MKRDTLVFYRSFYEAILCLPEEQQLAAFRALCAYGLDGDEVAVEPLVQAIVAMAKPQIEANNRRYLNGCKGKEFGRLGGAPKGNQNAAKTTPKQPQNNPKTTPNVNVNDDAVINNNNNNNINTTAHSNNLLSINNLTEEKEKKVERKEKEKAAVVAVAKPPNKEQRARAFYDRCAEFRERYSATMLREFYDYWTESNPDGLKMRFEMEKVFDLRRRLATWAKRDEQRKSNNYGNNNQRYLTATERLRGEYQAVLDNVLAKYRSE